jgi:hypothetical protein
VWFTITLLTGLGACLSCHSDRQIDPFLETHSQELVDVTVPSGSSSLVRGSIQRRTWSETGFWEFDTKMSRAEYAEWLNGKLRDQFHIANSADSQLSFSRNLDGDAEAVIVHLVPSGDHLHVRVEVAVSPD